VGVSTNIFTNQPACTPGIMVSNQNLSYVFNGSGKIRGFTGLYKTGSGRLTLTSLTNAFNGNVVVQQGTLAITNAGTSATIVSLGAVPSSPYGGGQTFNQLVLDGGALDYVGSTTVTLNSYPFIYPTGGTIGVSSNAITLIMGKPFVGSGTLTKIEPGILQLNSANPPGETGNVIVNGGTLLLNAGNAIGSGSLTLNANTTLMVTNLNLTFTNTLNVAGAGVAINLLTSTNIFSNPWTGAGSATFSNTAPVIFSGDMSGFSGTLSFGGTSGTYQLNSSTNKNPCTGSALATFDLGTGNTTLSNLNGAGLTYNLGALTGGANTVLAGRATSTNITALATTVYSIGANGSSTTFSGKIANGVDVSSVVSVVKAGSGGLLLNGINTYTGSTVISNGVLGGTGSIASALTNMSGGTLAPGGSATVGTFTVSNNVTLLAGGTVLMKLNRGNSPGVTNDLLVVTGVLTNSGALVVTNIGLDIYNGSKFTLFSKAVSNFTTVTLPATSPAGTSPYTWANNLGLDGSITLVSGGAPVNTGRTNVVTSVTGGALTLTWPMDHTGWRLQNQTNLLSVGLYTNWSTVLGSTTTNSMTFQMDGNNGSVFFRLIYP